MENVMDKKDYCTGWWLVFIAILVMMGVELVIPAAIADNHYYGMQFLKKGSIIVSCIIGFLHLLKRKELKAFKSSKFSVWLIPIICILPLAAGQVLNIFLSPVDGVTSFLFGLVKPGRPERLSEIFFAVTVMCFVAPILEEIFFRGILMHYFKNYGIIVSLLMSAIAFAFIDFSPETFLYVFLMGILLGSIKIATDSLVASMIAHAVMNASELIFLFIPFIHPDIAATILIASIVAFPTTLYLLLKMSPAEKRELIIYEPLKKTELSLAMLLCTVIYIIYMMTIILVKLDVFLTGVMYVV